MVIILLTLIIGIAFTFPDANSVGVIEQVQAEEAGAQCVKEDVATLEQAALQREDMAISFKTLFFKGISEDILKGCTAFSSLFPSRGSYDSSVRSEWYPLFSVLAYVCFFYLTFQIWGQRLINYFTHVFVRNESKFVFWCTAWDDAAQLLAESIQEDRPYAHIFVCLFSTGDSGGRDYALYHKMNEKNFRLIFCDNESPLPKECRYARNHFFFSNDEMWNIHQARGICDLRCGTQELNLYIKINETTGSFYTESWAKNILKNHNKPGDNTQVNISLFNESELIARAFVREYPLLDAPGIDYSDGSARVKGVFRILVLGLGHHGKAILRHALCDCQFVHQDVSSEPNIMVDIIDNQVNKIEHFFSRYPDLNRYCHMDLDNLSQYAIDVFSMKFKTFLKEHLQKYNRIIIALGSDARNRDATAILETCAKGLNCDLADRLYVVMNQNDIFTQINANTTGICDITSIGHRKEIFTAKNIIDEEHEDFGKRLHSEWKKVSCSQENVLQWAADNSLTYFKRKSSIAQAAGCRNIIKLLYPHLNWQMGDPIPADYDSKCEAVLELLAETEHLRWNAFHFANGVAIWDIQKDKNTIGKRANDIEKHNRHASLVDWKELPTIGKVFYSDCEDPEMYPQEYDRMFIKKLRKHYEENLKQARKTKKFGKKNGEEAIL